jgi:hypothetical protein
VRLVSVSVAIFVAAAGFGCASEPFPRYRLAPEGAAPSLIASPTLPSAEALRIVTRAIVEIDGAEVVTTVYVVTAPPSDLRVAAVSDLGTTAFDAVRSADGARVVTPSSIFGDDVMTEHLLPDLAVSLLRARPEATTTVSLADGRMAFLSTREADEILVIGTTGSHVVEVLRGHGSRVVSRARLHMASGAEGRPERLEIENFEVGYRLVLHVLEIERTEPQ